MRSPLPGRPAIGSIAIRQTSLKCCQNAVSLCQWGIIIGYDNDDDPILIWNSGYIHADYISAIGIVSESSI